MKPWKLERDQLVETTMSFVEGVSAVRSAPDQPSPAHSRVVLDERPAAGATASTVGFIAGTGFETSMRDERDEIIRRATAFRELQIRFGAERRQYCDAVLARTRTALGHRPKLGN
jgi:hypothetical protein